MSQVGPANTPGSKKAILHYKVLDQQEINRKSRTLLKIRLETGLASSDPCAASHEGLPPSRDRKYNPFGRKRYITGTLFQLSGIQTPQNRKNDEV